MKVKFLPSGVGPMKYIITIIIIAIAIFAPHKLLPPALAQTTATLDPTEARILNSIFQKWGILANNLQWNLSGQLCTGFAVDSTSMQDTAYNPAIKCTCSSTVCHITALKVQAQDVTGGIPDELWNLTSINDLNLGQNYLNGTLSRSIGNLRRLQYLTVGKNALSGVLPKELGMLTDLRSFSISTNNFSGSLPSELGNLKKLTQLYIDSSGVSGPIPPSFANLLNLETVWASDIELTGRIPDFIGNWAKLNTLRLQGNSFQGPIPSTFLKLTLMVDLRISDLLNGNSSLDFIRNMKNLSKLVLRNNNISASIPSNIGEYQSLSLLALPSGLNCLQKNFPCHRGKPIYSSFAIKCGGQQITSSNELLFERDNETLGPATYYMTSTGRWAVSNVGLPSDSTAPEYTASITRGYSDEIGNTIGKGNLKEKDFDIKKIAGGSLRALSRKYTVHVSENHMDIHLFWAGKGTCCVPRQGTYGPLISAISATADFHPTVSNEPPFEDELPSEKKKNRTGMVVGIVVGVGVGGGKMSLVYISYLVELLGMDAKPYTFTYAELKAGTSDFSPSNKLGEGGFGPVYKGTLEDGRTVAVKQLSVVSRQGKRQFVAEVATISAVQHRNLVKLYGCCYEGDNRLLVYEYHENKSLDKALFDKRYLLEWAWQLHENNSDVDVVDEDLLDFNEDEVKRVIGVSLLCTQASPASRPSMSRVVAMLSGDTEVPILTSKPSYITDCKFDDKTSLLQSIIRCSQTADEDPSVVTTSVATTDLNSSPLDNPSRPILREIIGDGR
nr:probable LRR receptor-like serine/threonine-protein kinase At1g56140 isoform X1 [Ipomoea batatas]